MRCFIICNGPSLNEIDITKMKDDVTFASNDARLFFDTLKPTYWFVEDTYYFSCYGKEIYYWDKKGVNVMIGGNIITDLQHNMREYVTHPQKLDDPGYISFEPDFSEVPMAVYDGATVTYSMLQIAYQFGYDEVYIVGCDAEEPRPKAEDHFTTDYAQAVHEFRDFSDLRPIDPDLWRKAFRKADEFYRLDGRVLRIANGKNSIFERVDYDGLF